MENQEKMKSRKFVVWLVWLAITLVVAVYCVIIAFVANTTLETAINLLEKVIGYFFAISMMYLGANVGQKVGFAISDAIATKGTDQDQEKENAD